MVGNQPENCPSHNKSHNKFADFNGVRHCALKSGALAFRAANIGEQLRKSTEVQGDEADGGQKKAIYFRPAAATRQKGGGGRKTGACVFDTTV
jgi:hypothetical protein